MVSATEKKVQEAVDAIKQLDLPAILKDRLLTQIFENPEVFDGATDADEEAFREALEEIPERNDDDSDDGGSLQRERSPPVRLRDLPLPFAARGSAAPEGCPTAAGVTEPDFARAFPAVKLAPGDLFVMNKFVDNPGSVDALHVCVYNLPPPPDSFEELGTRMIGFVGGGKLDWFTFWPSDKVAKLSLSE